MAEISASVKRWGFPSAPSATSAVKGSFLDAGTAATLIYAYFSLRNQIMGTQSRVDASPSTGVQLQEEFFRRVWGPAHDLSAIDELMTEDYVITSGGAVVRGRVAFKRWVAAFQLLLRDATNENLEVFTNAAGDRVVSRWI